MGDICDFCGHSVSDEFIVNSTRDVNDGRTLEFNEWQCPKCEHTWEKGDAWRRDDL